MLDFGLVKQLESDGAELTHNDQVVGTPAYLAPESIASPDQVGPAIDLYSLGAVGYCLVTGAPRIFRRDHGRDMRESSVRGTHATVETAG